jgi:hypothetical protein
VRIVEGSFLHGSRLAGRVSLAGRFRLDGNLAKSRVAVLPHVRAYGGLSCPPSTGAFGRWQSALATKTFGCFAVKRQHPVGDKFMHGP